MIGWLIAAGLLMACAVPGFEGATAVVPTVIVIPNTGEETGVVPTLIVIPNTGAEETATAIPTGVATAVGGGGSSPGVPVVVVSATPIPPTPSVPMVTPNAVDVNCRSGPDLAYDSVSVLPYGAVTSVAGRTPDSSWWYVDDPNNPSGHCWVAASVVTFLGPGTGIPLAELPAPIANQVTVAVTTPPSMTCGVPNPVALSGTISTNGATTVTFQWEITGAQTITTTPQTLAFTGAGTQNVAGPAPVNVDCGSYMVALHVTGPNNLSASKSFTVAQP
jgi:hypothetical protein